VDPGRVQPPARQRTALVTGASSGIGLSFARRLAAEGHGLVLVARTRERLETVAADIRSTYAVEVEVLAADVGSREELAAVEQRLSDPDRPVQLLVNNAGFALKRPFLANSVEDEQYLLDTHVTAVMRLTHAALATMVPRGDGRIVNVSSVAGFLPRGSYSAAKGYVTALSTWADLTYRDRGVRVMALLPGFTRTGFHDRMDVRTDSAPRWMWLDPDRLVEEALRDLRRGRTLSIPSRRYKALSVLARTTPAGLHARFQGLGRR
jgi:short-subunit dehydrogenase